MRHDQQLSLNTLPLHYGKVLTGSEGGSSQPIAIFRAICG